MDAFLTLWSIWPGDAVYTYFDYIL
jgi:hypothetical protein